MEFPYLRDKSWMYADAQRRTEPLFEHGVYFFINFAYTRLGYPLETEILCPCSRCMNLRLHQKDIVQLHIFKNGFVRDYIVWNLHGENIEAQVEDEPINALLETLGETPMQDNVEDDEWQGIVDENEEEEWQFEEDEDVEEDNVEFEPIDNMEGLINAAGLQDDTESNEDEILEKYKADSRIPLYPNCKKFSKLSFFVRLFNIKCKNRWSNKSFSELLELLKDAFPEGNCVPPNWYESQKIITNLGLNCNKIHACRNDCVLFWKEHEKLRNCPVCNFDRFKPKKDSSSKDVPVKILRHFPLIPRLKRLFMYNKTAEQMLWHHTAPSEQGKMTHPRDSESWKILNQKYPAFKEDPRNVRLGLASDGFSPFGMVRGVNHSTWPVVIIAYNLPPWLAMHQSYFMLSLLIDGPSSPGKHIDVYLQPLIDELLLLWHTGIRTFDAHSKQFFQLHAALLWTINDFPAYGMLSGWTTQGKLACPCCHVHTGHDRLPFSGKEAYMYHRRFLPIRHRFRRNKNEFNGKIETGLHPVPLSGQDILRQWRNYHNITFGKMQDAKAMPCPTGWKKLSAFFQLPYWSDLPLRHNLDVMHIEKGVAEHVINILISKDGKSKDNLNARRDLTHLNIRKQLQPQPLPGKPGYYLIPSAIYNLNKNEKKQFLRVLKELKVPDGFSSNFARQININEGKITGLKSHDYHVLMQHLLPLCLRTSVNPSVGLVLNNLCTYFRELCSKSLDVGTLKRLEVEIPIILCKIEMIFPPSFFDIIVHLTIHLATEAKIAGPVQYRWMYPIERYLLTLKNYIRNKYRPEGSIAEGYLLEEVTTFCSRFLNFDVETKLNKTRRVIDGPLGNGRIVNMSFDLQESIHAFILLSNDRFKLFADSHRIAITRSHPKWSSEQIDREQKRNFHEWCISEVEQKQSRGEYVDPLVHDLLRGPMRAARFYKGYGLRGYKFETEQTEHIRATQNSGIAVVDEYGKYYFGVLEEVIAISYVSMNDPFYIFQCRWYDNRNTNGIKTDQYGLTLVNTTKIAFEYDKFIFPEMATQVYYSRDLKSESWSVVCRWKPRDVYALPTLHAIEKAQIMIVMMKSC